ncbi:MAG: GAF domain-containing protein [Alphaproteobacteria bacterium]|nr:GAF domain-containing protein [Alphaproteobacteria bacterium]
MTGRTRSTELLESERNILQRIAAGDPLENVLEELIHAVEGPAGGDLLGSILFLSEDGRRLLHGAAPSLPAEYNSAIHGIEIGPQVGSCGTAAHTGQPVYVCDIAEDPLWASFRELALRHGLRACWSTPIRGTDGKLIGTFANYYREPRIPTERDLEIIAMVTQTAAIAVERHRIEMERRRSEEQHLLLLRELNHRVKNLFTLTKSLVVMTARSATSPEEMSKILQGRIFALSRAHELVQPGLRESVWDMEGRDVPLRNILQDILSPHVPAAMDWRVHVDGPEVAIRPSAITSLALVLHELATNAAKYGAFSNPDGRISVRWELSDVGLELSWQESGGPRIESVPERTGFGTVLAQRSVEMQLAGEIAYDWAPDGLCVRILLPSSKVAPYQPAMDAPSSLLRREAPSLQVSP